MSIGWILALVFLAILVVLGVIGRSTRKPKPPYLTDDEVRGLLDALDPSPLPTALQVAPPREDVFSGKGYLRQDEYRQRYLPLLLHGHACRAVCSYFWSDGDADGIDAEYEYAWLDTMGRLRREKGKDSYDPVHAAFGSGQGNIVIAADANLAFGEPLTVVYATNSNDHVLYDALHVDA